MTVITNDAKQVRELRLEEPMKPLGRVYKDTPIWFSPQGHAKASLITTGVLAVAFAAVAFSQSSIGQTLLEKTGMKKAPIAQNHTAVGKYAMPQYLKR